jgi:hypothetical protein
MATSKNARPTQGRDDGCFGLLANGSSGQWEVGIDETTTGPDRWFAQLEGPSVSFYFEISSVDIVAKMIQFLESSPAAKKHSPTRAGEGNGALVLSKDKKSPVTLVKDDEYEDRFFLVVGLMESPTVRFVLAGTDATQIADALRQVKEDLEAEA